MIELLWCIVRTWWCKRRGRHNPVQPNDDGVWYCPNCYEVSVDRQEGDRQ